MKPLIKLILIIFLLPNIAAAAPTQWETSAGGNGHWYEIVTLDGGILWTDANAAAAGSTYNGLAGHLVTITSEAENNFILGLLDADNDNSAYENFLILLGGRQTVIGDDSSWSWVTGETLNISGNTWDAEFWLDGEPDESYRHYLGLQIQGGKSSMEENTGWFDIYNNLISGWSAYWTENAYIIEYDTPLNPVPAPSSLLLLGFGILGLTGVRRKNN